MTRLAGPIVLALVGLFIAGATANLALGPGVADVGQPVAKAAFPVGLVLIAAALVWLAMVLRKGKSRG